MAETTPTPAQPPWIGLADLLRMSMKGIDLAPLAAKLIEYAQVHPRAATAMLDASVILQLRGNREIALQVQREALKIQRLYTLPHQEPVRLRLLVIVGPGDMMANSPVEFLVQNSPVATDLLWILPEDEQMPPVPPHDVLFVAVAESEENRLLLDRLAIWLKDWPRPVLNRPEAIRRLSRDSVSAMLREVPDVELPQTVRADRATLQRLASGELSMRQWLGDGDFPVIVRPVDSHAGKGLEKVDGPAELADCLTRQEGTLFFVARFVDYRGADGLYRKYRIVLMRGVPHLCHLALSSSWMVHYLSADMLENPANRAEEAWQMTHFREEFALRHASALQAVARASGLDYLGIDCSETRDGRLLVFEIDSNMVVHDMDPPDIFPYKAAPMQAVFAAFQAMLGEVAHG